jgi:hypothetical protein
MKQRKSKMEVKNMGLFGFGKPKSKTYTIKDGVLCDV